MERSLADQVGLAVGQLGFAFIRGLPAVSPRRSTLSASGNSKIAGIPAMDEVRSHHRRVSTVVATSRFAGSL